MTPLSSHNSPLPLLCFQAENLRPDVKQQLEEKLYPYLALQISEYFWDVVGLLALALKELPFSAEGLCTTTESRHKVLGYVRELMHQLVALKEYLGDVLTEILPRAGKKPKKADQVKLQLENTVSFLFKAPINLVKHERFKLYWLEQSNDSGSTPGFVVTGLIAPRTTGPGCFKTKAVAEGYSFALLLRQVLPTIFELCGITATALSEAGLVAAGSDDKGLSQSADKRTTQLVEVVDSLGYLSNRGFPNEVGTRVPEISLKNNQLYVNRIFKLQGFGTQWKVHFTLPPAKAGDMFKLPYWVPRD